MQISALNSSAEQVRALVADTALAVTLTAQAYTTVLSDLDNILGVTTGATNATITLLAAASAGVDAVQSIRKVDTGAGQVIVKAGGVIISLLTQQWDTVYLRSDGSTWSIVNGKGLTGLLARKGTQTVGPSNTTETVVATILIPGGLLGLDRSLWIDAICLASNTANAKTFRGRLGGTGIDGTILSTMTMTSVATGRVTTKISNRGAANSQLSFTGGSGTGTSSAGLGTAAVDTSADTNLYLNLINAGAPTDTLNLERYSVWVQEF